MELSIEILVIVVVLAILLIWFIIRKNRKDQKDLEETIKKTDIGTDHHKEERI
jgi:preprotein translocase subunit YajC